MNPWGVEGKAVNPWGVEVFQPSPHMRYIQTRRKSCRGRFRRATVRKRRIFSSSRNVEVSITSRFDQKHKLPEESRNSLGSTEFWFSARQEAQFAKTVVLSKSEKTTALEPAMPAVDRSPPSPRTIRKRVNQYNPDIDVIERLEDLCTLQLYGLWLDWSKHVHQDLSAWQRLIHRWRDADLRFDM